VSRLSYRCCLRTLTVLCVLVSFGSSVMSTKVKISWLNWDVGSVYMPIHEQVLAEFGKTHPNIEVEMVQGPYADPSKFLILCGNPETMPDIIWVTSYELGWYVQNDLLMDVSQLHKGAPVAIDRWFPIWRQMAMIGGHLYGVPCDTALYTVGLNLDMISEAGLVVSDNTWTWDEYMGMAAKLTRRDAEGNITHLGGSLPMFHSWLTPGYLRSFGGSFVTLDGDIGIDRPESLKAYEFLRDLYQTVAGSPALVAASGLHMSGGQFDQGRVAMTTSVGCWEIGPLMSQVGFAWRVAKVPRGPAGRYINATNTFNAIPKGAQHPKEAWELIRFLNSDWALKYYAQAGRNWPPSPHMMSAAFALTGADAPVLQDVIVGQLLDSAYIEQPVGWYNEARKLVDSIINPEAFGDGARFRGPISVAAKEAARRVRAEILPRYR